MMSSEKRVVLITGCSAGIGRALAEEFLRRGDLVTATARNADSLAGLAGDAQNRRRREDRSRHGHAAEEAARSDARQEIRADVALEGAVGI
jgi:NAD(P)-dependent dehydrogenase (short-subunit alcohol dehydrogenase family)